jgi:hypothetical protein
MLELSIVFLYTECLIWELTAFGLNRFIVNNQAGV